MALAALGLALAVAEPAAASPTAVARFAVVVGNNQARVAETLRYADDDALAMHELFLDAKIESRLLVSLDADTRELHPEVTPAGAATLASLERALREVDANIRASAARGAPTELYFFYSGHGDVEAGEGRLLLEDHALTRTELYELLSASSATRSHVFLDACSSFLVASKRADAQRREPVNPAFALAGAPAQLGNVGFVLSSSSDRESHEWARYEAGIVSHELRSALRGAADADLDGSISYAELAAFLRQANRAIDIPRLRPDPFVVPPGKTAWQAPVLTWEPGSVSVRVKGGAPGHFFVENARGERLLDAHPAAEQWLHLHLPEDRPLFIRGDRRPLEYELADGAARDIAELAPVALAALRQPKGAEQRALSQLFAMPFERGDVREYERRVTLEHAARAPAVSDHGGSPWLRPLGVTALAGAAVGAALSSAALVTYLGAKDAPQLEARRANDRLERYHRLSLIPYGAAALAGAGWLWLKLHSDDTSATSFHLAPAVMRDGGFVEIGGQF